MQASIHKERSRFIHKIDYAASADSACTAHNPVLCSVCDIIIIVGGLEKKESAPEYGA
jgi:hypothetical protein